LPKDDLNRKRLIQESYSGNFLQKSESQSGEKTRASLYVVATPIGNLGDMSARAIHILESVQLVAAEDTRQTHKLLSHFGISTPLTAYHDFSDRSAIGRIVDRIQGGEAVALVSDAGTPLLSDPGYGLVESARRAGIEVLPIPGASALTAALCVAGLPTDRFTFEGFLPAKAGQRDKRLHDLVSEQRTLVFYEAPHRIGVMLEACLAHFGASRKVFIGRELTKRFEQHFSGELAAAVHWLAADSNHSRGEFVIVLAGCDEVGRQDAEMRKAERQVALLREEMSMKKAVALTSTFLGVSKNDLYRRVLASDKKQD
tara:strand:+ start:491 stop:1432 length:942 start_codon:yes stop_codon:yes gene_type:complete